MAFNIGLEHPRGQTLTRYTSKKVRVQLGVKGLLTTTLFRSKGIL